MTVIAALTKMVVINNFATPRAARRRFRLARAVGPDRV
jgi:hypothetical protein